MSPLLDEIEDNILILQLLNWANKNNLPISSNWSKANTDFVYIQWLFEVLYFEIGSIQKRNKDIIAFLLSLAYNRLGSGFQAFWKQFMEKTEKKIDLSKLNKE